MKKLSTTKISKYNKKHFHSGGNYHIFLQLFLLLFQNLLKSQCSENFWVTTELKNKQIKLLQQVVNDVYSRFSNVLERSEGSIGKKRVKNKETICCKT